MSDKIYRSLVLVLLVVLILAVGANAFLTFTANKESVAQAELCRQAVTNADLSGLLTNYQKAVYDNPSVDNINKQILMANEYQVVAIAAQTTILSTCLP